MGIMVQMNDASKQQVEALNHTSEMFLDMQKALEACTNSIRVVTDMIRTANEEREKVTQSIEVLTHLATDNAASTEETSSMTNRTGGNGGAFQRNDREAGGRHESARRQHGAFPVVGRLRQEYK